MFLVDVSDGWHAASARRVRLLRGGDRFRSGTRGLRVDGVKITELEQMTCCYLRLMLPSLIQRIWRTLPRLLTAF